MKFDYLRAFKSWPDGCLSVLILYDKRDDFDFAIVNLTFMRSNIPESPAYGVYISQLIRYSRACSDYQDFLIRGRLLTSKLLKQGYQSYKVRNAFKKFYICIIMILANG